MNATIQDGPITYVGFDPKDNGKFTVEHRNDITYVVYQRDEFSRLSCAIKHLHKGNIEEQFKFRYVLRSEVPYNIMEHINNGGTAYTWWNGKTSFGTNLDEIIEEEKRRMLHE